MGALCLSKKEKNEDNKIFKQKIQKHNEIFNYNNEDSNHLNYKNNNNDNFLCFIKNKYNNSVIIELDLFLDKKNSSLIYPIQEQFINKLLDSKKNAFKIHSSTIKARENLIKYLYEMNFIEENLIHMIIDDENIDINSTISFYEIDIPDKNKPWIYKKGNLIKFKDNNDDKISSIKLDSFGITLYSQNTENEDIVIDNNNDDNKKKKEEEENNNLLINKNNTSNISGYMKTEKLENIGVDIIFKIIGENPKINIDNNSWYGKLNIIEGNKKWNLINNNNNNSSHHFAFKKIRETNINFRLLSFEIYKKKLKNNNLYYIDNNKYKNKKRSSSLYNNVSDYDDNDENNNDENKRKRNISSSSSTSSRKSSSSSTTSSSSPNIKNNNNNNNDDDNLYNSSSASSSPNIKSKKNCFYNDKIGDIRFSGVNISKQLKNNEFYKIRINIRCYNDNLNNKNLEEN